uniref:CSON001992 protein n=1 Tax=Culicoides sonorensis TaxID=179676 RepID=A0A336MJF3_CULSO
MKTISRFKNKRERRVFKEESIDLNNPDIEIKRKRVVAKKVFHEFCDSSTIHGLKYLGTRPTHEKIWWIAVFSVSLCICGFQIKTIWNKWDQNPVIVSFNENLITISEINFPAVTICHQNRVRKSHFNYGNVFKSIMEKGLTVSKSEFSESEMKLFELIAQTCIKDGNQDDMRKLVKNFVNKTFDLNPKLMEDAAPVLNETLIFCAAVLVEKRWACQLGFGRILTEEGVCYTFNLLNKTELLRDGFSFNFDENFPPSAANWSFDMKSIKPEDPQYTFNNPFYPFRIFTTGQKLIVYLASNTAEDLDESCPGYGERFRVFIHGPDEIPWHLHHYYDIDIKTYTTLSVTPQIVMATDRMETAYSPEKRRCYFDGEKTLKYFKRYTKKNCELECFVNITQSLCNCTRFNFPRDPNTRICGLSDYICVSRDATYNLHKETASASLNSTYQGRFKCNCWAGCRSIQYEAQVREAKLFDNQRRIVKIQVVDKTGKVENRSVLYDVTKLYVTFKDSEFFAMKRSELYGLTDFIANCGGLLGLFMGVSLLSFVEIIYFFAVRLVMGIFNRHKTVMEVIDEEKAEEDETQN